MGFIKLYMVLPLILLPFFSVAQGQGNIWVFGESNQLDFNVTPPSSSSSSMDLLDGQMEAAAGVCNEEGELLFYSDSRRIWDWNNALVIDTLKGHQSSTQGAFIVPKPNTSSEYYLFTLDAVQNDLANGLRYSRVTACRGGGVSVGETNILLAENMTEKMTVVSHVNQTDYWLIAHEVGSNRFVVFIITESGVQFHSNYFAGSQHGVNSTDIQAAVGCMKASPDGSLIACTVSNSTFMTDVVYFNNQTGEIGELVSFVSDLYDTFPVGAYGISFSPNSQFLYLASSYDQRVFQFNASLLPDVSGFLSSRQLIYSFSDGNQTPSFQNLQLAVDGKIYLSNLTDYLASIELPDIEGIACSLEDSTIHLPNGGIFGLPAFIDSYDYTASGVCDTGVGVVELSMPVELEVYPNPFSSQTQLHYSVAQGIRPRLELRDMLGRVVQTVQLPSHKGTYTLSAAALGKGIYFCTLLNGTQVLATEKLVVVK